MEKNKYNNYFIQKTIDELLIELLAMKKDETKLDWYEALKAHLKQRDLTENEREQFELLINPNYSEPLLASNYNKLQKENNVTAVITPSARDSKDEIISIRSELKQLNANYESLVRKNKTIEQQFDLVTKKLSSIGRQMLIKYVMFILLFCINTVLYFIQRSLLENEISNEALVSPYFLKSSNLLVICVLLNLIIIIIIMLIDYNISDNFQNIGKRTEN